MVQRPVRSDAQAAVQPGVAAQAQAPVAVGGAGPDPRAILDSIGETVYDWDIVSDRLTWGPNALTVLGVGNLEQISSGRAFGELITSDSVASRYAAITGSSSTDAGGGVSYRARYGIALGGGRVKQTVWLEDTGRWFAGPDGKPARAHGAIRVITSHYEAERELEFRSRFDPLTNCYNRAHILEIVTRNLSRTPGRQTHFCILLASLENLFVLNRTYGYDVADEVIACVAKRLRGTMRGPDSIGRYAGAKFALVLDNCDRDQMMIAAQRFLNETSREPFETSAGPIPVALRIGGVAAPRDGRSANLLFQHAEEALDLARSSGATRLVAYEPSLALNDTRVQAARMADEIVGALNDGA